MRDNGYRPSLPIRLMQLELDINARIEEFEAREGLKITSLRLYRREDGGPRASVAVDERHV